MRKRAAEPYYKGAIKITSLIINIVFVKCVNKWHCNICKKLAIKQSKFCMVFFNITCYYNNINALFWQKMKGMILSMKMTKKMLALALSLMMIVSMFSIVPMGAFASLYVILAVLVAAATVLVIVRKVRVA